MPACKVIPSNKEARGAAGTKSLIHPMGEVAFTTSPRYGQLIARSQQVIYELTFSFLLLLFIQSRAPPRSEPNPEIDSNEPEPA